MSLSDHNLWLKPSEPDELVALARLAELREELALSSAPEPDISDIADDPRWTLPLPAEARVPVARGEASDCARILSHLVHDDRPLLALMPQPGSMDELLGVVVACLEREERNPIVIDPPRRERFDALAGRLAEALDQVEGERVFVIANVDRLKRADRAALLRLASEYRETPWLIAAHANRVLDLWPRQTLDATPHAVMMVGAAS